MITKQSRLQESAGQEPVGQELGQRGARVLDLYGPEYDFPSRNSDPSISYMLAALPRSGSTYLAVELWRTGVLGSPMEYPNTPFMERMRKRLNVGDDFVAYWRAIKRVRTSPNGVFGFKMFVADYIRSGNEHPELLPEIAPDKVIFLTRSNLIEQAVSYSKAMRSGAWFHDVQGQANPAYDADDLETCLESLRYQIDFWNKLFALTKAEVHHVTYESLVADPAGVIEGMADFLDVKTDPSARLDLPHVRIQRDAESAEWVRKYSEERNVEDGKE